jgi:hypothetical protein
MLGMKTQMPAPEVSAPSVPQKLSSVSDQRSSAISQAKLREMAATSPQARQLKALQEVADNSPVPASASDNGLYVAQRARDVRAEVRKGSVVVSTFGYPPEFKGGDPAGKYGWNGVEKYKAEAKVGDNPSITLDETRNDFLVAQAGHVLGDQNGGKGSDKNNVFAQDGGVNNGPFRREFENPMRRQLDSAEEDDDVSFRVVLYGTNITQGKLAKETDLAASEEDSDFEGF